MADETQQILTVLEITARGVSETRLRAIIARWSDELRRSQERDVRINAVLEAVRDGYDSIEEIVSQTGFARRTVFRYLDRLHASGRISIRFAPGKRNRPRHCYTLV